MGREDSWFSSVKKTLSPSSKAKKPNKPKNWFKKINRKNGNSSPLGCITFPVSETQNNVKLVRGENGYETHTTDPSIHAAQISVSRAVPEVVSITSSRIAAKINNDEAAIKIQKAFRGYLARREFRGRHGLLRLKSFLKGPAVERQVASALLCFQKLFTVQSQIHHNRIRVLEENQAFQKQHLQNQEKELEKLQISEEWDDSLQSKEQIEANLLSKTEAAIRRERALAYAYSHQQRVTKCVKSTSRMLVEAGRMRWGWVRADTTRGWDPHPHKDRDDDDVSSLRTGKLSSGIGCGEVVRAYALHRSNASSSDGDAAPKRRYTISEYDTGRRSSLGFKPLPRPSGGPVVHPRRHSVPPGLGVDPIAPPSS